MATIRLVPSTYSVSNNTVTVSNPDNMYTNVDSTNYATITHTTAGTTSYYLYLKGFNVNDVPDNAEVSSIVIKIRGYESGLATSASYAPRLYNNTSTITGASAASSNFGTSTSTITVPYTGTWATLKGYGADLGIRLTVRRNQRNTQCYIYVYGAEVEVTYTVPVYHTVTSSTSTGTINPNGSTSVLEGTSYTLTIFASNPSVTDNGNNVTSQLVRMTGGTSTLIPYDSDSSGFSISNITNAYHNVSNTTYADCSLSGRTTGQLYLDLGPSIPSGATISSVSCQVCYQVTRNNSSSSMTASCQLYSGNTAKGSSYTIVTSATDVAKTTATLTPGSWTANEIANARLYITMYNGASSTVRHIYVYGVSFTVTYTINEEIYTYTINNITTDHTIVVSAGASPATIYLKNNGSWVAATAVYKKVNGSWVLQNDLSNVFDSTTNYVKG